jgi:hypothetical protein
MTNRFVALLGVGDFREELAIFDRYGSVKTRFFEMKGFRERHIFLQTKPRF